MEDEEDGERNGAIVAELLYSPVAPCQPGQDVRAIQKALLGNYTISSRACLAGRTFFDWSATYCTPD
jgi:hypothetical protein